MTFAPAVSIVTGGASGVTGGVEAPSSTRVAGGADGLAAAAALHHHQAGGRGLHPERVADAALRGIEKGRVVIPVGAFAHTLWRLERLAPALVDLGSGIAARKEDRKVGHRIP